MASRTERRKLQDTIDDMRETLQSIARYDAWAGTTAEQQAHVAQDCLDRHAAPKPEKGGW